MADIVERCTWSNSYTRCKDGWVYMPDGYGCVQSEHCPKCDGTGKKRKVDNGNIGSTAQKAGA